MKKLEQLCQSYEGKTIAVLGMGVSNIPLISLLLDRGISVCIRDKNPDPEKMAQFKSRGAIFVTGEDYLEKIQEDVIFRTPGLSPLHPALLQAKAKGVHFTSEMQEFFHLCPCPIIAVTGSDGKTTTTTLISAFLKTTGKNIFVGGNIGRPLLCDVDKMTSEDLVVLELSSFQLMDLDCSPAVAVVTNLSPNHLDYHKDMAEYVEAKCNIFQKQNQNQRVIFNLDNEETANFSPKAQVEYFSRFSTASQAHLKDNMIYLEEKAYLPLEDIQLKGTHNTENYMAAILAVRDYCTPEQIQSVAKSFFGVEHRMQLVRKLDGVSYYNDSIGTSPTRTIAGLRSFEKRIILIAGGYDKGIPFAELGTEICHRVKDLILCGATADAIHKAVENTSIQQTVVKNEAGLEGKLESVRQVKDLNAAIFMAKSIAIEGDCVVLSPACAAFDQFKNFAQRGEFFTEVVNSF